MSKTAIIAAVKQLDLETTKKLLRAEPELLTVTERDGRNLLHLACSAPGAAAVRMARFLLDRGLPLEEPVGKDRCTPLWFAVGRGRNRALVELLIERGAAPARAPGHALYAAGWYEDLDILDLLLRAGATIDVVAGVTPFLACWQWRKFEAAKHLAERGADVNARDPKTGKTALHVGIEKQFDPALLRWLVAHGASPDIADHRGVTARQMASRKRDKRWLSALGASA